MTETGSLSDLDLAIYRTLAAESRALDDLARRLAKTQADVMASLERLIEAGLVLHGDEQRFIAVSPELAEAQTLGAEELELNHRRITMEQRRAAIRRAGAVWGEALTGSGTPASVEAIYDRDAISNVLMHYATTCEKELLSVAPGSGPGRIDGRTRSANLYSLQRGVRTLALYQHVALRDRATRSYLRELVDQGALVRVAAALPGRSLVIDRQIALLPIPRGEGRNGGLAVVREPNVVAWVIATFEQMWSEASTLDELLGAPNAAPEFDQTRAAILRMMGEGEKDEAISRRLSISVRTCRRHIADYMTQTGASSRFQAGVIAAREGHLDGPSGTV